jgi:hypothetical protein
MKFCYTDESGMGAEPVLVMAGIIVDAQRMHVTKDDWGDLLKRLSAVCGRELKELHMREMYRGNGPWREVGGQDRARLISEILDWWIERKHLVTFTALDKGAYSAARDAGKAPVGCETPWRTAALHLILTIQKHFDGSEKNKGHTLLLFDHETQEEGAISDLVASPPEWTDEYYGRGKKQRRFDQIIDAPFFGDSQQVLLLQVADLIAYLLRHHAELEEGRDRERYAGESDAVRGWVRKIMARAFPASTRWPRKGGGRSGEFLGSVAPVSLVKMGDLAAAKGRTEAELVPEAGSAERRPPAAIRPVRAELLGEFGA